MRTMQKVCRVRGAPDNIVEACVEQRPAGMTRPGRGGPRAAPCVKRERLLNRRRNPAADIEGFQAYERSISQSVHYVL
jgi:hypothetical protein